MGTFARRGQLSREGQLLWRTVKRIDERLMNDLVEACAIEAACRSDFDEARRVIAEQFGLACQSPHGSRFARMILIHQGRLREFEEEIVAIDGWPVTKLEALRSDSPEAFKLHKSVVESGGISSFGNLLVAIGDALEKLSEESDSTFDFFPFLGVSDAVNHAKSVIFEEKTFPFSANAFTHRILPP